VRRELISYYNVVIAHPAGGAAFLCLLGSRLRLWSGGDHLHRFSARFNPPREALDWVREGRKFSERGWGRVTCGVMSKKFSEKRADPCAGACQGVGGGTWQVLACGWWV
jgi:hypothetical protein